MNGLKLWKFSMKVGNILGCHQRADRSFFIKGSQFPLCARCTGMLLGYLSALFFKSRIIIPVWLSLLFCAIMFSDWFIQYKKIKSSTNFRRFFTGLFCGFGIMDLLIMGMGVIMHGLK